MNTYSFNANGRKIEVEAARMLEAMGKANKLFGSLPQGAWMASGSLNNYYWAKGNFFD
jgi:hypothetical protein